MGISWWDTAILLQRFPEPWGASQAGWITSLWLVNLLLFAPLVAIQKLSQKSFYLCNLKPFSSYPPGQKLALLWSWHSAALSQLLGRLPLPCAIACPQHISRQMIAEALRQGARWCVDSCRTPSLVEQGARILPKRRQEIHYPCCPARTNTLTGTHSHVLGRMLCTQALAQREILVPPPFTPCREIRSPLVLMSHTAAELPEEQVHSWAGCKGQALPGLFPVPPWWQEALCVCAGWQDKDSFQQGHTKERHPTVTRIWGKGPGCCIPFE